MAQDLFRFSYFHAFPSHSSLGILFSFYLFIIIFSVTSLVMSWIFCFVYILSTKILYFSVIGARVPLWQAWGPVSGFQAILAAWAVFHSGV